MSEAQAVDSGSIQDRTTQIVSAYVSKNPVPAGELPGLIASIHASLQRIGTAPSTAVATTNEKATPAQIRKSVSPDALISFEDGKSYKTLRRHLTLRGLTPDGYRAKWGLPRDYPMTCANYSEQRSALARSLGLGKARRGNRAGDSAAGEKLATGTPGQKRGRGRRKEAEAAAA